MTADKEELRQLMKQKFGVDLVFHGSKDKPYGYTIIDHQSIKKDRQHLLMLSVLWY